MVFFINSDKCEAVVRGKKKEKEKTYMNKSPVWTLYVSAPHSCQIWVIFLLTYFVYLCKDTWWM